MMKTIDNNHRKRQLLKRFHVLLNRAWIDEDGKRAILATYGVEHSSEMDCEGLADVCDKLTVAMSPRASEADRWRKRVMASVFAYCRRMGYAADVDRVKAIACRAAGTTAFNRIPLDRLRSLYNAFNKRTKDLETVGRMTEAPAGSAVMNVMYQGGKRVTPKSIHR